MNELTCERLASRKLATPEGRKGKKTKLNMVNELLELSPRARYNRLAEMQTDLITDEDIKKGWPKV